MLSGIILSLAGGVFFVLQNSGQVRGGSISVAKTLWLFTVLFYWYMLPAFWWLDSRLPRVVRLVFLLALVNMIVRAIVELPMMYVTDSWLHIYGIMHNVCSIMLSIGIALWLVKVGRDAKEVKPHLLWVVGYFIWSAVLFFIESIFAYYLRMVTSADGSVFFLPASQSHLIMQNVTIFVVVCVWVSVVFLTGRWYAQSQRT